MSVSTTRANMNSSGRSITRGTYQVSDHDRSRRQSDAADGGADVMARFMEMEARSLKLEHTYDCIRFDRPLEDEEKGEEPSLSYGDLHIPLLAHGTAYAAKQ